MSIQQYNKDNIEDIYPLSDIELGMIYLSMSDPSNRMYHNELFFNFRDNDFDSEVFYEVFKLLSKKHNILRTGYDLYNFKQPVHIVFKNYNPEFKYYDLRNKAKEEQQDFISSIKINDREISFDFKNAKPIWKIYMFHVDNENIIGLWINHHAMLDGWSFAKLTSEVNSTYRALKSDDTFSLGTLQSTYKDYVVSQMIAKKNQTLYEYWKTELEGYKKLDILSSFKINLSENSKLRYSYKFNNNELDALNRLSSEINISIKHITFSAYVYAMGMLTYDKDIILGLLEHGRPLTEDGGAVLGCFLNELPIRVKIPANITWLDFIYLVDKKILEVFEHDLSLFEIKNILDEKSNANNPIFDSMYFITDFEQLNINNEYTNDFNDKSISVDHEISVTTNTLIDFNIRVRPTLDLTITYHHDIPKYFIEKIAIYFVKILELYCSSRNSIIDTKDVLSLTEKKKLLCNTHTNHPSKLFIEQIENQVSKTPDRTAAVYEDLNFSYGFLNSRANQIAHYLIENYSTGEKQIVGLYLKRNHNYLLALLGTLKAGFSFLPIDNKNPIERIYSILDESGLTIIISEPSLRDEVGQIYAHCPNLLNRVLFIDDDKTLSSNKPESLFSQNFNLSNLLDKYPQDCPDIEVQAVDLVYTIFTSGSTGKPKGVMIHHEGMMNHLNAKIVDLNITPNDVIGQTARVSFDISIWQFLSVLLTGGKVIIIKDNNVYSPEILYKNIQQHNITIIELVPTLLNAFVELNSNQKALRLRWMIPTGEALSMDLAKKWFKNFPDIPLLNAYGPTEASDDVTHCIITESFLNTQSEIPIGKPIQNISIYILDKNLNICPEGVQGEICVTGIGVGKGYLNNEKKTNEVFVPNKFDSSSTMLYRTGDIGYIRNDGYIICLGRIDYQVKIRGYRIELGEIENQLLKLEEIKETVVLARDSKEREKYLCAYYISDINLDSQYLKTYLLQSLPDYMVPSYFIQLQKFPLSPSGKIDRKKLPEPEYIETRNIIPAQNKTEKELATIWADILDIDVEDISIKDNFFELGGHSLKAIHMISQIHKRMNVRLSLIKILEKPTIQDISRMICFSDKSVFIPIKPAEKKEYYQLTPFQKTTYFLQKTRSNIEDLTISGANILHGSVDVVLFNELFNKLIRKHECLRTFIRINNSMPVQSIVDNLDYKLSYYELNGNETIDEFVKNNIVKIIDIDQFPLFKIDIVKIMDNKYLLNMSIHHIISDVLSINIFFRELLDLYTRKNTSIQKLQFKDYCEWYNKGKQNNVLLEQERYWMNEFSGNLPELNLPKESLKTNITWYSNVSRFVINENQRRKLETISKKSNSSLFTLFYSVYYILLYKITSQTDIITRTMTASRDHADLSDVFGNFINVLAIRVSIKESEPFFAFHGRVKEIIFNAFANQNFQFDELIEKLTRNQKLKNRMLTPAAFIYNNIEENNFQLPNIKIEDYYNKKEDSGLVGELSLFGIEHKNEILFTLEYSKELFKEETIDIFVSSFQDIISTIVENENIAIADILTSIEKKIKTTVLLKDDGGF